MAEPWSFRDAMRKPERPERPIAAPPNGSSPNGSSWNGSSRNGNHRDREGLALYLKTALEGEANAVAGTATGGRNMRLNIAAFNLGQLVHAGLAEQLIRDTLTDASSACGLVSDDGLGSVNATITSGVTDGQKKPRVIPERDSVWEPPPFVVPGPAEAELDAFWDARPLLRHVHTYARARRVSPLAVLGVTLARIVTAVEPFVVLPPTIGGPASLNLFVGLVGASGAGKGAAEAVAREAVVLDGIALKIATTGSGEGIAHAFMRRIKGDLEQHATAVLFTVPEIDTLTALGNRQGATLIPELRRAWSGERLGFAYADPMKALPVGAHKYRLCLVAGIQPGRAGALLDDVDAGTPQRWVWLEAGDPDAPDVAPLAPDPWRWRSPGPITVGPDGLHHMPLCASARATLDASRLSRLRKLGDPLEGHALLAQAKVAAAFALADERLDVREDDWQLADVIARISASTRGAVVAELALRVTDAARTRTAAAAYQAVEVAERVDDAGARRVSRAIARRLARAGSEGMSRGDLRNAIAARDRKAYFEAALEPMLESGEAVLEQLADGDRLRLGEVGQ